MKALGHWKITKKSIKIVTDSDFCKFYRWLLIRGTYFTKKFQIPLHGAHINIVAEKIHNKDCSDYLYLNGKEIWFQYDVSANFGGFKTGKFVNYWLDVKCIEGDEIQRELGIFKKTDGFSNFHITICNSKNLP